jgi:predicted O-methyltransferase YrrM
MEHVYQEDRFGPPWFGFADIYKEAIDKAENGANFVEVGSFMGKSAAYMCVEIINSGKEIFFDCVDTWEGSVEHQELDVIKNKQLYDVFMDNMKDFMHVVNPLKMASVDAARCFDDESLDFVFIDASHEEQDVKDDIDAWLPKVKKGGVLAGDDWGFEGVVKAVQSKFLNTQYDIRGRSWVVQN